MIKAITSGKMYPIAFDDADIKNAAKAFRGASNQLTFMSTKYNASGVHTTTPREDQYIFMDSTFNAEFDVDVLASAFNMDKATFIGKLKLIDDWTTFDSERFDVIMAGSDMIEPITQNELALMANVKAVLIDSEWFQIYDNANRMTEKYVASGMYWNYFYNVWKTVSSSPFSNAIVFVTNSATITPANSYTVRVDGKTESDEATVLTLSVETSDKAPTLVNSNYSFEQTEALTRAGIAIQKYGAVIIPASQVATEITLVMTIDGVTYTGATTINGSTAVDTTVTMNKGA